MDFSKYVELDEITLNTRHLVPIARMSGFYVDDTYLFCEYTVVAFVIYENDSIYYENVLLSEDDFESLKNNSLY